MEFTGFHFLKSRKKRENIRIYQIENSPFLHLLLPVNLYLCRSMYIPESGLENRRRWIMVNPAERRRK